MFGGFLWETLFPMRTILIILPKTPEHQPGWIYRNAPKCKVEIYASNLCENGKGGQAIAKGLPCRLRSPQKRSVSDDFWFVSNEIHDEEIEEEIVHLETRIEEDEDAERGSESLTAPIVRRTGDSELCDEDSGPDPPSPL